MINPAESGLTLQQRLSRSFLFNELGDRWISRRKIIAGSNTNLMELGEIKYQDIYDFYAKAIVNNWNGEQFSLAKDEKDYSQISEVERKTVERVLASLVFLESELLDNYYVIVPYFTAPECTLVASAMIAQTANHANALSNAVRGVVAQQERDPLYNSWRTIEKMRERNKLINNRFLEFINKPLVVNFIDDLVISLFIQVVMIPSELSLVYSLTRRGRLPGTFEILRHIQRDLDVHSKILTSIYHKLLEENQSLNSTELKDHVVKLIRDLTNLETDFTQFLTEGMIPGLNNLMIAKFTQAQANKVLKMLSLDPLFPGVGGQPIPWFESYSEIRIR